MLFKLQNIYVEADEISGISAIRKYNGSLSFDILMKNKNEHQISWSISNNFDEEDVLFQKMETLRRDIAKFKNGGVIVLDLGQAISLKKPKELTTPRALRKASK